MEDTSGATAIEYTLIVSLLAIVIVAAVTELGTALVTMYARIHF